MYNTVVFDPIGDLADLTYHCTMWEKVASPFQKKEKKTALSVEMKYSGYSLITRILHFAT